MKLKSVHRLVLGSAAFSSRLHIGGRRFLRNVAPFRAHSVYTLAVAKLLRRYRWDRMKCQVFVPLNVRPTQHSLTSLTLDCGRPTRIADTSETQHISTRYRCWGAHN